MSDSAQATTSRFEIDYQGIIPLSKKQHGIMQVYVQVYPRSEFHPLRGLHLIETAWSIDNSLQTSLENPQLWDAIGCKLAHLE